MTQEVAGAEPVYHPMAYKDPERQREYQRQWQRQRRELWLRENGPCVDCGSSKDLEVDHVDPTTKVTHNVWSWRESRRREELAKCVVRCRECHALKSKYEHAVGERHGQAKLTDALVLHLRNRVANGEVPYRLAKEMESMGYKFYTVRDAIRGSSWRHLP